MATRWIQLDPRANPYHLGFIPSFLNEGDPRSAKEQFKSNYSGGWMQFQGFTLLDDGGLKYPGDPPMRPLFMTQFRDETITVYECSWVMIMQKNGEWEVARMD